ncbi:hypothetical protein QV06_06935 [Gallibacterium genomosp. 3]|uniref:Autotransporter domain-containing protein n=1 Tax=Gallibacterium genomosp. 3 TaxID=505345 RepID=A0A1A7PP97_9PAST|nr:autotransporter-associated beta strand repeat-containing protein [Gallibacterium genomosp. 3]OBX04383.1 hypothetical protein QV06_06935 [Gallibacterium genomosp. 3]
MLLGGGYLEQAGSGTTSLVDGKTYDYSGKTIVSGGELDIVANTSITQTSDVLIDNQAIYDATQGANQAKLTVNGTLTTANNGDVEINSGLLTVNGTATVGNIKSTDTEGTKLATVNVASGGTLTTNLTDGDVLFQNFKSTPAPDIVTIDGTWNANVASGTVAQEADAAFTGSGKLVKQGAGQLTLNADNSIGNLDIDDGKIAVSADKSLTVTNTINIGNNVGKPKSAGLEVNGSVTANDINIKSDGDLANKSSGSVTVNNNLTIENGGNANNEGTLNVTQNLAVNGGTLASSGTTTAGTLTVNQGTNTDGTTRQGEVNITGGTTTATTTTVNSGTITASGADTTFNAGAMTVGDKTGDTGSASVVVKDGATAKATSVTIEGDDGKVDIQANSTLTAANGEAPANIKVNGGELAVSGTVNAKNITSDSATADDKNAKVSIAGTVNLKPTAGDTLFSGFNTEQGDNIGLSGNLNVDVAEGVSVAQDSNANITALNDAKGTLNKKGAGTLTLTASNTLATTNVETGTLANTGTLNSDTTNINDGKLSNTGTLSSTEINVGDGKGGATTATLENSGTGSITSTTVNVKADGKLSNTATDDKATTDKQEGIKVTGTLNVQGGQVESSGSTNIGTLTIDKGIRTEGADGASTETAGSVSITGGDTTVATTQINDGAMNVSGGKLNAGVVIVGDGDDKNTANNAASLNITGGAVEATSVTVNRDGGLTNSATDNPDIADVQEGLNVTGALTVNGGSVTSSGTTNVAGAMTVESGNVNVTGGTTSAGSTTIKDGEVAVSGGKLNGGAITVGDNDGTATNDAAKLTISDTGAVEADSVTVKNDGNLTNNATDNPDTADVQEGLKVTGELKTEGGTINSAGTTTANDLTVDGGAVNVTGGKTDVTTTNLNDGTVNVASGATLDSDTLNVGNEDNGTPNTATLTNSGTVTSQTVNIKRDGKLANTGSLGTEDSPITDINVQGGTFNSTGTTQATNLTASAGTVALGAGSNTSLTKLDISGGDVDIAGTVSAPTTNISGGDVDVNANGKLDTTNIAISGGTVDVNNDGTITATNSANLSGGTTTVHQRGTFDLSPNGDLTLSGGDLTSDGTVKADEITVNNAESNLTLNAATTANKLTASAGTVDLGASSTTNITGELKANGGTINSAGTTTAGSLTVDNGSTVNSSGTTTINNAITVENGTVNVTNGTTTAATTSIKDGSVSVSGGTLNGGDITVGNNDGTAVADAAKLIISNNGAVAANNITVNNDGALTNTSNVENGLNVTNDLTVNSGTVTSSGATTVGGDFSVSNQGQATLSGKTAVTGDLKADNATINSSGTTTANSLTVDNKGAVNITGGTTRANSTSIKDGAAHISDGATLNGGTVAVGDGIGNTGTASLTNDGTVNASSITVKSDAILTNNKADDPTTDNNEGINVTDELKVESGTLASSGSTKADTLTVTKADNATQSGTVNITGGTTKANTTAIQEGAISVEAAGTLNGGDITVGDKDSDTATLTIDGKVDATSLTVNGNDGTVNVNESGQLGASSPIGSVNVDGGTLNSSGTTKANTLTVDHNGTVNVNGGTTKADNTDIHDGALNVASDATLDAGRLTVGNRDGEPSTASLNAGGTVKATDLVVNQDGNIAVNNGATVTATSSAKVAGGTIAINQGGILNSGERGEHNLVVDSGRVTVDGTLNAKNITSDPAIAGDGEDAKITVGSTGILNLKPANGEQLFSGLDTTQGDVIEINGALNVAIDSGSTVEQAPNAAIAGTGSLNKNGLGGLVLKAPSNAISTVNVNDGELTVDQGSKLTTDTLNVGNGDDQSATVNINGEAAVTADVNIAKDGTLNVGDASGSTAAGKLDATNPISMNGGTLNVNPNATLTTPNIVSPDANDNEASIINVANNATLNLNPTDGTPLFEGLNSTPDGKDTINIDGTLNLDVASGSITQPVSAPITGVGTLNKNGNGTFEVKADNPFAGQVNVNEGKLQMTEGGKLGQADVTVKSGATLAVDTQGTSLGSLTLNGALNIIATPTGHSQINIARNADTANGILFIDIAGSDEDALAKVKLDNILQADTFKHKQPDGTYIDINKNNPFSDYSDNSELFNFVPQISPDGKSINLIPTPATKLVDIAKMFNLKRALGAATALDANFERAPKNELSQWFYRTPNKQESASRLLDALPSLIAASGQVVANTSKRLANLAPLYERCYTIQQPEQDKHLWVKPFGRWATQQAYYGATGYQGESYGFAVGLEKCRHQSRLGVMIGYAYDHIHSNKSISNQRLRADTIQAGLYGNTPISTVADLDFKAGIGYSDISSTRYISFANHSMQGNYVNKIGYAAVGLNFNAYTSQQFEIKPFIRLDYQVVRHNNFSEIGTNTKGGTDSLDPSVLHLHVNAGTYQSFISQVGMGVYARLTEKLTLNSRLGIGYDLIGEPASIQAAFIGASDLKFTTESASHGRINSEVSLNISYQLSPMATISVGYDATARKGYIEHNPTVSFKMTF